MPSITITKEATENSYSLLEPGIYEATVEKAELQTSRSGNEMFKLELIVAGTRKRLWHYLVFTEAAAGFIYQFCLSAGIPCHIDEPIELTEVDLIGATVQCDVIHKVGNDDVVREKIKRFIPRDAAAAPKKKSASVTYREPEEEGAAPVGDDDLPF